MESVLTRCVARNRCCPQELSSDQVDLEQPGLVPVGNLGSYSQHDVSPDFVKVERNLQILADRLHEDEFPDASQVLMFNCRANDVEDDEGSIDGDGLTTDEAVQNVDDLMNFESVNVGSRMRAISASSPSKRASSQTPLSMRSASLDARLRMGMTSYTASCSEARRTSGGSRSGSHLAPAASGSKPRKGVASIATPSSAPRLPSPGLAGRVGTNSIQPVLKKVIESTNSIQPVPKKVIESKPQILTVPEKSRLPEGVNAEPTDSEDDDLDVQSRTWSRTKECDTEMDIIMRCAEKAEALPPQQKPNTKKWADRWNKYAFDKHLR